MKAEWRLLHAGDTQSDSTETVWFRDSLEAHELAALRVAAGQPLDAWFWPLAVPALVGATSTHNQLRAIAFALAAQNEAPAALPAWAASLVRAGHRDRLIAALRPGDGRALLHAAGVTDFPVRGRIDSVSVAATTRAHTDQSKAPPTGSRPVLRGSPFLAASDDRLEFIDQMMRRTIWRPVAAVASSFVDNRIDAKSSDARNQTRRRPVRRPDALQPTGQSTPSSRVANPPAAMIDGRTRKPVARARHAEGTPQADRTEACIAAETGPNAAQIDTPSSPWAFPGIAPTAAGGLLFLVPALERLGFSEWSAKLDAAHLPAPDVLAREIFHVLLSRLRIAGDDPAWQLAAPADETSHAPEHEGLRTGIGSRLSEHASAAALRGTLLLMLGLRIRRNATIPEIWLGACRRLLRRRARIGLATLVVRPARMALTRTHVDVFFALNAADLRVRRAGLDIDPGWVRWLAKVVHFHYQD